MTAGPEIIQLAPDRWQEYRAIRLYALQESPQAFGSSYADNLQHPDEFWITRLHDAESGRSPLLFAEEDGKLVGMIGAFIESAKPDVTNIISVFVVPEYRGRGVSRQLVDAILSVVRQRPAFVLPG